MRCLHSPELGSGGEHAVGLVGAMSGEVINEDSDVSLGSVNL